MVGFISQGIAGITLLCFGNVFLGCCSLIGAAVCIATANVGGDEE